MFTPDVYKCTFCGAEYEPSEFYEYCHSDGLGQLEFRCSCGCHEYTPLVQCKFCHDTQDPRKNKRLRWWRVCDDCLGAIVAEYNSALDGIAEDYRKILEQIYDIRPINMEEE